MNAKTPMESYTEHVQILTQSAINGGGRLFGGYLMQWIDIVGGVAARRHAQCFVTTASVDALEFKAPAFANDLILLTGKVVYTGKTSMVVSVKSYVENLDGSRRLINSAYLTMVALDQNNRPCPVPALIPQTEEEKAEYEKAEARRKAKGRG